MAREGADSCKLWRRVPAGEQEYSRHNFEYSGRPTLLFKKSPWPRSLQSKKILEAGWKGRQARGALMARLASL